MKQEENDGMREFIAKFNKLASIIPTTFQPTATNLKCFFINTQVHEVSFLLRRVALATLVLVQSLATEIENDLILVGKIRKDAN